MKEILAAIAAAESQLGYVATLLGGVHTRAHLNEQPGEYTLSHKVGRVRERLGRNILQLGNIKASIERLAKEVE